MKHQSLTGAWEFRQSGNPKWLSASVPGGVHTDLLALKLIPDPFVGDNEKHVAWVAENDWEYKYQFNIDNEVEEQENIFLVCDGLDTLATISLNGQELGHTNNMFRQYRWDVKNLVKQSENILLVNFQSPVKYISEKQKTRNLAGVSQAIPGGPHIRKAPCQFGWDWGPQLPPIGIWKDIRLEGYNAARIEEVHLTQEHNAGKVIVHANIKVEDWTNNNLHAQLNITAPDGTILQSETVEISKQSADISAIIENPLLWWPNDYGDQPLYQVSVQLKQAESIEDEKQYQIGLRTVELRQEPDQWGKSFTFVVNGKPIFAKGSDWIPADSFPTRITDAYLEMLIKAAADTHQNMLRVWGGGFFEEERFYDLCDKYGILIWQDFIFSCSVYPLDDEEFVRNVEIESRENIRRLRHRASLALWCGNNEMEWGWVDWAWDKPEQQILKDAYDQFFHHTLPAWCAEEDPEHAYWPSSPSSGEPFADPNGQIQGDAHYWDVWHGRKPFTAYRDQFPRFMSEFGFQALPPMETIRTYAQEKDWNMTSYIMERHQKNDSGNQLMVAQMLDTFRLPDSFESLVYLSLVLQAEGIRYGVEHWRRHPNRVSGIIYWQLNDCWPVASWSSLDYFGRWKALHYAAKRFFAPLMLSIEDNKTVQNIYLSSDLSDRWEGSVKWSLETLDGQVLESGQTAAAVASGEAAQVCNLDFEKQIKDDNMRKTVFIAELWQNNSLVARQCTYFVPTKHLDLVDPQFNIKISGDQQEIEIKVTSQSLARLVEIKIDGADVVFSDNYFDLPAGRTANITAPLPTGWTLAQVQTAIQVRSVYTSYAHGAAESLLTQGVNHV